MIASWIEENEITQVQSQKDISEVQQPLCRSGSGGEGRGNTRSVSGLVGLVKAPHEKARNFSDQEDGYFRHAISGNIRVI